MHFVPPRTYESCEHGRELAGVVPRDVNEFLVTTVMGAI